MKKLLAILLAAAMFCAMSVTTFAADVDTTASATSADLKVKYAAGTEKTDNYAVTIQWTSMEFTWTSNGQHWDTETMKWVDNSAGSWDNDTHKISFSNKSSQPVSVTLSYTPEENSYGVTGLEVNGGSIMTWTLNAATAGTNGNNGTAYDLDLQIEPTGFYTGTSTEAVKVGTITITLSDQVDHE